MGYLSLFEHFIQDKKPVGTECPFAKKPFRQALCFMPVSCSLYMKDLSPHCIITQLLHLPDPESFYIQPKQLGSVSAFCMPLKALLHGKLNTYFGK